jgi:hypothetical protein
MVQRGSAAIAAKSIWPSLAKRFDATRPVEHCSKSLSTSRRGKGSGLPFTGICAGGRDARVPSVRLGEAGIAFVNGRAGRKADNALPKRGETNPNDGPCGDQCRRRDLDARFSQLQRCAGQHHEIGDDSRLSGGTVGASGLNGVSARQPDDRTLRDLRNVGPRRMGIRIGARITIRLPSSGTMHFAASAFRARLRRRWTAFTSSTALLASSQDRG